MAVRTSMATLIARVRSMTTSDTSLVTDQQVQDELDRTRLYCKLLRLAPLPTIMPGGELRYYEFSAPWEDWEDTVVIQNSGNTASGITVPGGLAWGTITPATSDTLTGRWIFSDYYFSDLFLTGFTYDRFMAAANVIRVILMSPHLRRYSFSDSGQMFNVREIIQNYKEQADLYLTQARVTVAEMTRSDVFPGGA